MDKFEYREALKFYLNQVGLNADSNVPDPSAFFVQVGDSIPELDWVTLHHQVLSELLLEFPAVVSGSQRVKQAGNFLSQWLDYLSRVRQASSASLPSFESLDTTLNTLVDGILVVNLERRITYYNPQFSSLLNIPMAILQEGDDVEVIRCIQQKLRQPEKFTEQIEQELANPELVSRQTLAFLSGQYFERFSAPQRLADRVIGRVVSYRDITDRHQFEISLKQANTMLQTLANLDSLTQIANRRYFDHYFAQEWRRLTREQKPLAFILLDVDYFKNFNDYYGHQKGDACLLQIAQAIQRTVKRPADLVARYGGEEFAVILPGTDREGAAVVAQLIHQAIRDLQIPHERSGVSDRVSISLGVAHVIPTLDRSPTHLIIQADQAMYNAKQQGRDRYYVQD